MKVPDITLEDLPADKANCGNCTRKGGSCPRKQVNKNQHNGYIFRNGEVVGMICGCPNYTGSYQQSFRQFNFDL